MPVEKKQIEISWDALWRIFFFALIVLLIYYGRNVFLSVFVAIIISSGVDFIVDYLEKLGLPRTLAVILLFLFGVLAVVSIVYTIIPIVILDLNSIFSRFKDTVSDSWWGSLVSLETSESLGSLVNDLTGVFLSSSVSALGLVSKIFGGIGFMLGAIVISFYLSISRDGVERFIRAVFPRAHEPAALRIYARARKKIGYWLSTQIILSFIIGIITWVTLLILGVKHAFLLGIIAGILEIVPFVGPILAGAAAVGVALFTSTTLAMYTLIAFIVIQQLETHLLVPLLMRRIVGLHPVIVIVSLLIGAEAGGFLGLLISVPAAALIQEIVEEWSREEGEEERVAAA